VKVDSFSGAASLHVPSAVFSIFSWPDLKPIGAPVSYPQTISRISRPHFIRSMNSDRTFSFQLLMPVVPSVLEPLLLSPALSLLLVALALLVLEALLLVSLLLPEVSPPLLAVALVPLPVPLLPRMTMMRMKRRVLIVPVLLPALRVGWTRRETRAFWALVST
jgi:hypothetical protein